MSFKLPSLEKVYQAIEIQYTSFEGLKSDLNKFPHQWRDKNTNRLSLIAAYTLLSNRRIDLLKSLNDRGTYEKCLNAEMDQLKEEIQEIGQQILTSFNPKESKEITAIIEKIDACFTNILHIIYENQTLIKGSNHLSILLNYTVYIAAGLKGGFIAASVALLFATMAQTFYEKKIFSIKKNLSTIFTTHAQTTHFIKYYFLSSSTGYKALFSQSYTVGIIEFKYKDRKVWIHFNLNHTPVFHPSDVHYLAEMIQYCFQYENMTQEDLQAIAQELKELQIPGRKDVFSGESLYNALISPGYTFSKFM
ncbi:MAG: hypothetical protein BGO14_09855 [Chlamydiales bacterium 38-26]|nr:hypothetical protein [Chlamydiales bacterium]OJV11273.1 MAG: hypothetical protein BGO14_09855 [Chlamydiales bacterium 38-26]